MYYLLQQLSLVILCCTSVLDYLRFRKLLLLQEKMKCLIIIVCPSSAPPTCSGIKISILLSVTYNCSVTFVQLLHSKVIMDKRGAQCWLSGRTSRGTSWHCIALLLMVLSFALCAPNHVSYYTCIWCLIEISAKTLAMLVSWWLFIQKLWCL